jgi:uncharacterized protein (DUF1800 family)
MEQSEADCSGRTDGPIDRNQGGAVQDLETDVDSARAETEETASSDASVAVGMVAAAAALALTGCGGGDDEGGRSAPPVDRGPAPTPVPPPPAPGPRPPAMVDRTPATDAEAARFLLQAQFSVTEADIDVLRDGGILAWLNARYAEPPGQTGCAWLDSRGYNAITAEERYFSRTPGDYMIWNQLIAAPDQMRKRMALALSELFVVSLTPINVYFPPYMIGAYWDLLTAHAFGNFRDLLEAVTLNAAMGFFLNTRGNLGENSRGRQPDENYAREVMQLFTIGLYELNLDGTQKLDAENRPIETYGPDDVSNLARVFTGYSFDYLSNGGSRTTVAWSRSEIPSTHFASNRMRFNPNNHSRMDKNFLGVQISSSTPGTDALTIALDRLFYHANTGPFFARQMIQRLVTSNPSPAYVQRVATVFGNNGADVRGDLKAVWTAILTDEEARAMPTDADADALSGKLREPIVRFVQWARTAEVASASGAWEIDDLSESDRQLGQSPLRSPSVFNFFRPGYVPPNTGIAEAGRQAPEFQLLNESSTAGYINFMQAVTRDGIEDVLPGYPALLPIAHDVPAVIEWLDLHLTANQLSGETLDVLNRTLRAYGVTASSGTGAKLDMLAAGFFLVLISPDYLVQK